MELVQGHVVDFFTSFSVSYVSLKKSLKKFLKVSTEICTLSTRLESIKETNLTNSPLSEFKALQGRLVHRVGRRINRLMIQLHMIIEDLNGSINSLSNKRDVLKQSIKDAHLPEDNVLVTGNAFQPSLKDLLIYATEANLMFHTVLQEVRQVKSNLSLTTSDWEVRPSEIKKSLEIDQATQKRMDEIVALTQNCGNNVLTNN